MSAFAVSLEVSQYKQDKVSSPLRPLWIVTRYWGHGGYTWFAVMDDGELMCAECLRANYRQIVRSTLDRAGDGWQVVGVTNSGELEGPEQCAQCGCEIGGQD